MARLAVAGCLALTALGAVAVLDVGSPTAEAAPSVSPFAGTYAWSWLPVTISDAGRIKSDFDDGETGVSISGRVTVDGSYSFTTVVTYTDERRRGNGWTTRDSYPHAGHMALDADGNLVLSEDVAPAGATFLWVRQ